MSGKSGICHSEVATEESGQCNSTPGLHVTRCFAAHHGDLMIVNHFIYYVSRFRLRATDRWTNARGSPHRELPSPEGQERGESRQPPMFLFHLPRVHHRAGQSHGHLPAEMKCPVVIPSVEFDGSDGEACPLRKLCGDQLPRERRGNVHFRGRHIT